MSSLPNQSEINDREVITRFLAASANLRASEDNAVDTIKAYLSSLPDFGRRLIALIVECADDDWCDPEFRTEYTLFLGSRGLTYRGAGYEEYGLERFSVEGAVRRWGARRLTEALAQKVPEFFQREALRRAREACATEDALEALAAVGGAS